MSGTDGGAPVCPASIPATSQLALIASRASLAIRGSRRPICAARSSRWAPGSGSDRTSPRKDSRAVPYLTG